MLFRVSVEWTVETLNEAEYPVFFQPQFRQSLVEVLGETEARLFIALHADARQLPALVAAVAAGKIPFTVARRLPPSCAPEAHCLMEAGGLPGKIVLEFQQVNGA